MIAAAVAFIAGVFFAIGLVISDMTSPGRIMAFLDITGNWDPTLAFVMGGAIMVFAPVAWLAGRRPRPLLGESFYLPDFKSIDARLVGGSVLFGIGWGLAGYCPAPALVAVGTGALDVLVFVAMTVVGIALARLATRRRLAADQ